jgi:acyl-coenzyme A synthetase/AMP-(fatty) acid ligase
MRHHWDVGPGEVLFSASDVGWVVGHSYIVYAPLLVGATTVLYEGKPVGTPDPGQFWRVIAQHRVKALFTAPTALRAIKKEDPEGAFREHYDLSELRYVFLAGERLDTTTLAWAQDQLGVPVIDHWWQTETGWPVAGNLMGVEPTPVKPGSVSLPIPGWHIDVLDADGRSVAPGTDGAIALKLPLPPEPATAATSTRTATCSSWAAPTTSSTSPGTGCPPPPWKRLSPRTRPSPNAPSSASRTPSRARSREALSCSRRAPTTPRTPSPPDSSPSSALGSEQSPFPT